MPNSGSAAVCPEVWRAGVEFRTTRLRRRTRSTIIQSGSATGAEPVNFPLVPSLPSSTSVVSTETVSLDTRARRQEAAERARASARLEGEDVTPEMAELMDRHVAGELSAEQLLVEASRLHR